MQKTGVFIDKNDVYTIMATGQIDFCPGKNCKLHDIRPELGWPLIARIGSRSQYFMPLPGKKNSATTESLLSGELLIGYQNQTGEQTKFNGEPYYPESYMDDAGSFSVDIIVWSTKDYIQIADFLSKQMQRDPESKALRDSQAYFNEVKKVILAEKKASQELETTRQEISLMQGKAIDQEQLQALERRLAKLAATLAELEKMKRELGMERQKSQQLSQQLAEKEQREQQLLIKLSEGVKNPPVLLIAAPKHGMQTEAKSVQLSAVIQDETGLQQLDILVNNLKVNLSGERGIRIADSGYPRRLEIEQRIGLSKGANIIEIQATDTDGLLVEKSLTVHRIERRRNLWAVIMGIDSYPNIRPLNYAVADARAFYDLLVMDNQVPPENVFLLLNEQATLPALRSTLGTKVKNKAGADDMVIIYFAGHGATERDMMSPDGDGLEKYLLPYEANPNDLYASALPMREVAYIFNRIRSERLVFVVDACYSGASGGRTVSVTGVRANLSDRFLERLAGGKGKVIITASSANEVSVEKDELGHGVFTYYLMQGLRGSADTDADGLVTVDEAYRYVSEKVPAATGQEQHPVKKGSVEGQLVMGIVP
ncbi:MAG: caspase family protein [Desulfobacteraceae bacterium]